ncbi:MAG: peptide-methionine (S)-S-oxide reductase MsrA [Alphaproteobacteria bacterium]|nr:peptide-methionine (S)-S-oxide reductase MsrA [Alphaproteobacteria bacterium]
MIADTFPNPAFNPSTQTGTAVLAGGCFWCTEGAFLALGGVTAVRPGYAGGSADTANYKAVCEGTTGHAEVIEITYDTTRLSYGDILKIFFWLAHDPTQKNRQGHDVGSQYRSAIFYQDALQKEIAEKYIAQLNAARVFDAPIATTVEKLDAFYVAESYHHNYAALNPMQGYIRAVAQPKIDKVKQYQNK